MATEIELKLVLVKTTSIDCTNFPATSISGYRTEPIASDQPAAFDHEYSQPEPLDQVKEVNANNSSSLTTNISYTIT